MNVRAIVNAAALLFVFVVGAMFYMVRPPANAESGATGGGEAGATGEASAVDRRERDSTSSASVRDSIEKRRAERRRLSERSERIIQSLETEAELRRRGSQQGATWTPNGGGWGR